MRVKANTSAGERMAGGRSMQVIAKVIVGEGCGVTDLPPRSSSSVMNPRSTTTSPIDAMIHNLFFMSGRFYRI